MPLAFTQEYFLVANISSKHVINQFGVLHIEQVKLFWAVLISHNLGYSGFCNEPKDIDNAVRSVPGTQYKAGTRITYTYDECYTGGGTSICQCNDLQ